MLRILMTGLALTLPLALNAQEAPAAAAPKSAPAAAPAPAAEAAKPAAPAPAAAPAAPAPAPAQAAQARPPEYLPNLYDVTVVETWDTLNVRETPDGQGKVIATLPATAKGIELLARDREGKWGKVNVGEQTGWVALRFLKLEPGIWQPASLPQSLHCSGTEPFWSLKAVKSGLVFSEPDQPERQLELRKVMDRGIEGEPTRGLIAGDGKGRVTAFMRPAQCSDGMSDRDFALAVSVILDGQDMPSRMLTGCCSIAR
ncbi:SH3 domain-containing protein [Paracoccus litorisediminis]|jgi:uncharacterized membrane protein|uniref:COG3650 family protein n=1 Tax=Paracoccus litorisediminis TaxID=2006130 RepID=UPI001FEB957E|nr:SH3 domain-containing protein [Paracoccus litorisediminis]